jgi:hypothetical protein
MAFPPPSSCLYVLSTLPYLGANPSTCHLTRSDDRGRTFRSIAGDLPDDVRADWLARPDIEALLSN